MLALLHEHCPETRELDEWPALWAYARPEPAEDLQIAHLTVPPPGEPADHPAPPAGAAP